MTHTVAPANAADAGADGTAIRPVVAEDLPLIIDLDRRNTGVAKPEYWRDLYERYANAARGDSARARRTGTASHCSTRRCGNWRGTAPNG